MAWLTALVTAVEVTVAPVMAWIWPSPGVWYLMTSKPPSGACCRNWFKKVWLFGVGAQARGLVVGEDDHAGDSAFGIDAGHHLHLAAIAAGLCLKDVAHQLAAGAAGVVGAVLLGLELLRAGEDHLPGFLGGGHGLLGNALLCEQVGARQGGGNRHADDKQHRRGPQDFLPTKLHPGRLPSSPWGPAESQRPGA